MTKSDDLLAERLRDARARGRLFLAGGLAAVRDTGRSAAWVQLNLRLESGAGARHFLYGELSATAREFLGAERARNFFFMHKEPGIRVRFEAPAGEVEPLRSGLVRRFARCEGLSEAPVCVVYEPEHYLFGGHASMTYVHDLFTLDSLAWLDHHLHHPGREGQLTGWRHSMLMLREVFTGLGIVGWEHRGVWEAVRAQAGRGVRSAAVGTADRATRQRAAQGIVAHWRTTREDALKGFPSERRAALARHAEAALLAADSWRTGYFEAGEATVGPRVAAAYFTVFHWNRGLVSLARQSLLTDALADEGCRYAVARS
ncbi:thiopeptide-type bacteriocin biosynthesis protein [Streptomyces sp. NBC_01187]|uniref:thiopeptide-type bacteriocin biosynthesis protein n=1 Tax=Streptomyces sp. NBC_01187 TaxID=2903766 RepID=UPI00386F68D1|nr:thiopeptide-type bacteriocin biosynthesis protein [Streptomyces sp. NBC_01187]